MLDLGAVLLLHHSISYRAPHTALTAQSDTDSQDHSEHGEPDGVWSQGGLHGAVQRLPCLNAPKDGHLLRHNLSAFALPASNTHSCYSPRTCLVLSNQPERQAGSQGCRGSCGWSSCAGVHCPPLRGKQQGSGCTLHQICMFFLLFHLMS